MSIITLTTDFGTSDGYVAAMKGVILSIHPQATIVDITHAAPPQDIRAGAFALMGATPYFPKGTIHVAVVDPGVGSERRPIALEAGGHVFVGPDNGLLTLSATRIQREAGGGQRVFHLTNHAYWRATTSSTFHGRDIFAPVAAHLARGVPLNELGAEIADSVSLRLPEARADGDTLVGAIVYVDHFGNCITNIPEARLANRQAQITIGGRRLNGIRRTYAEAGHGELMALVSSGGLLEIAVRDGNAAQMLGVRVGDEVRVK